MVVLTQFALRLCFGLATAMALTSPRQVTSGFYRNQFYVLLGLNVLALLSLWNQPHAASCLVLVGAGIVLAYAGSVCWLYEKADFGIAALVGVAGIDILAAWFAGGAFLYWYGSARAMSSASVAAWLLICLDPVTSGLVTGVTIAAMLLGHWYLNSPTMELNPLKRLIRLLMVAALLRAILCAIGLGVLWTMTGPPPNLSLWFFALRWLSGVFGLLGLAWMALRTLDIPNTQSATGILYVAVIAAFTGELCGQLLSQGALYPL